MKLSDDHPIKYKKLLHDLAIQVLFFCFCFFAFGFGGGGGRRKWGNSVEGIREKEFRKKGDGKQGEKGWREWAG